MREERTKDISEEMWARLFYRSIYGLTCSSKFYQARLSIIHEAREMGFTHEQIEAIESAFDQVEICEPKTIRITLNWGEYPEDLDSHLVEPKVDRDGQFHVWYSNLEYYKENNNGTKTFAADLDHDDTDSHGPEITTIHVLTPGEYNFYVHDYTNGSGIDSTAMASSGARVTVEYPTLSGTERKTFDIDPASRGTLWNVFKISIQGLVGIVNIEKIDTYGDYAGSPIDEGGYSYDDDSGEEDYPQDDDDDDGYSYDDDDDESYGDSAFALKNKETA